MKINNKKILITGGYGLVGSSLYETLKSKKHQQIYRFHSDEYDLTSEIETKTLIKTIKPDLVFHLAASAKGVYLNKHYPATIMTDNIRMNTNILEACAKNKVEKVCLVSSSCAYPEKAELPLSEKDIWNGQLEETTKGYGLSKRILSVQSEVYKTEFGLNSFIVVPTNIYGPGGKQYSEHSPVVHGIIKKIDDAIKDNEDTVTLWGDGSPSRDFIYTKDLSEILINLMKCNKAIGTVNISSGKEIQIWKIANTIKELMGFKGSVSWDITKPNGQQKKAFDISYLTELIGKYDYCSFKNGLIKTIEWYNKNNTSLII